MLHPFSIFLQQGLVNRFQPDSGHWHRTLWGVHSWGGDSQGGVGAVPECIVKAESCDVDARGGWGGWCDIRLQKLKKSH